MLHLSLMLIVVAALSGCTVVARSGPQRAAAVQRPSWPLGSAVGAGAWRRVDADTIAFDGIINHETADEFLSMVGVTTKRVIVNSAGGEVASAAMVGLELRRRQIALVVEGYCLSSCANYWAVSAPSVVLARGVIGFHGNLSSCTKFYGGLDSVRAAELLQS